MEEKLQMEKRGNGESKEHQDEEEYSSQDWAYSRCVEWKAEVPSTGGRSRYPKAVVENIVKRETSKISLQ